MLFNLLDDFIDNLEYRTAFVVNKTIDHIIKGLIFNLVAWLLTIFSIIFLASRKHQASLKALRLPFCKIFSSPASAKAPSKVEQRIVKFLRISSALLSWCGFIILSTIPIWAYGFRLLGFWEAVALSIMILSIRYLVDLYFYGMAKNPSYMIIVGIFITLLAIGSSIAHEGCCNMVYEDQYGIYGGSFSTRLIREWQVPIMCPPGPPCHVYATLPEDSSTSVFITAQTSKVHTDVLICVQPTDSTNITASSDPNITTCVTPKRFTIPNIEPTGQRYIYSAYIGNLSAETLYQIQVVYTNSTSDLYILSEEYDFPVMHYHSLADGYIAATKYYKTLSTLR